MEKRSFRRGTMNENWQKEAFVGVRWTKIGKRRLSPTKETQKLAKIAFPLRGKTRNQWKSAFPHGGKQEIGEKRLSLTGKNQKTAKIDFPNIGKTRNRRKTVFPTLGRIKNAIGCISQLPERRKTPKVFYLTFGVRFILTHPLAGTSQGTSHPARNYRGQAWKEIHYHNLAVPIAQPVWHGWWSNNSRRHPWPNHSYGAYHRIIWRKHA